MDGEHSGFVFPIDFGTTAGRMPEAQNFDFALGALDAVGSTGDLAEVGIGELRQDPSPFGKCLE